MPGQGEPSSLHPSLLALREEHYHRLPEKRIADREGLARFIDEVGFALLFPGRGVELPSLWEAVCGGREPLSYWDDRVQALWEWKDELAIARRAWYGKYFHSKPTFISLAILPAFLKIAELPADPSDAQSLYQAGHLSREARDLYSLVLQSGPISSLSLRRSAGLMGKTRGTRFERALRELQRKLLLAKVGISETGSSWPSDIFAPIHLAFPQAFEASITLGIEEARSAVLQRYFHISVAATPRSIATLFGWEPTATQRALQELLDQGMIVAQQIEGDTLLTIPLDHH
ncbi:MAG: hypothetical protein HYX89_02130 [Chloroflexi bacterium]|nr:hypothetical protein [Chloroflexota bacterium]